MTLILSKDVIDHRGAANHAMPIPEATFRSAANLERWGCDPLKPDAVDDEKVTTSPRRLLRLMIAAADAAARFTREGLAHDPAAWMMAPRALFGGMAGMDACQELKHFNRSVVLHGLNLGLDADPGAVDALLGGGEDDDFPFDGNDEGFDGDEEGTDSVGSHASWSRYGPDGSGAARRRPQLLTCWIDFVEAHSRVFAFCAVVTDRPADLVERVIGRYGAEAAAGALFSTGYDHSTPFASAMISDAMAETLALAAEAPGSPLARGLDVFVEQRFIDCSIAA